MRHVKPDRGPKRYLFLILLIVSCLLIVPGCLIYDSTKDSETPTEPTTTTSATVTTTTVTTTVVTTTTTIAATSSQPADKDTSSGTTAPPVSNGKISFPDTLFIGDSRTHGLSLYGKISNAVFFAKTSLTSYSVMGEKVKISGLGEVTLEALLKARQFKTVYIMLGLNEIYKGPTNIANKYQTIINKVKETQPDAKIIVQSTLHVTKALETKKPTFKNSNINALNEQLKLLADGKTVFYLDINPVFDNKDGVLDAKYTGDGVHFYGKYYTMWRDYLYNNRSLTVPTTTAAPTVAPTTVTTVLTDPTTTDTTTVTTTTTTANSTEGA